MELYATTTKTKTKYDVQFSVYNKNGTITRFTCTNMVVDANQEMAFKRGELWHLPIVFRSTKDSVLTIDESTQQE